MSTARPLEGQVALITGGGSGIGAHIARRLSLLGMRTALFGRRLEKLESVAKEVGEGSFCVAGDVRSESEIRSAVAKTVETLGRLDVLVNNAGIFDMKPIEETSTEYWDDVQSTNLRGAFLFARETWAHLKASRGQLVNLSSIAGTKGFSGGAAYCASKFGMNGLTEVLKVEGNPLGIRVFAVCPGSVDTPLWDPLSSEAEQARMMRPETIADLVAWLVASPREIDVAPVVLTNFASPWDA